ncbi:ribonucleoside-diphosphate reductase subunit alpha [Halochromatium glycolicum]|uniref:Vitamin B12-dependent ribonucleotide reductase n=1 Tax=Halochromatium glycolicum TaxID=85075 RepID=A0AAJ0U2T7_9GAMM|nr:ribonucleoside-diphosphate reductase subunit alpha [Halochromatium glycolicum]MBK1704250.1 ribonucleotide-diphosphate reductase subunit alpha [Halochromatium glycolicum]
MTAADETVQTPHRPDAESPTQRQQGTSPELSPSTETAAHRPGQVQVIRRNGKVTHFDPSKIKVAMTKAFLAVEGSGAAASSRIHHLVDELAEQVVAALTRRLPGGGTVHIEDIQDQVELALMRAGEHKVARDYVLYRDARARERAEKAAAAGPAGDATPGLNVTLADGSTRPLDTERLRRLVEEAATGLDGVDPEAILADTLRNLFDGVNEADVGQALVMSARALIEREPAYSRAAARLLLDSLRREALGELGMAVGVETQAEMGARYADYFAAYIKTAGDRELLDKQLRQFDLARLGAALKPERDLQFNYLGLQTLYDRYFIHTAEGPRIELPQAFFMRVAMGLAINEIDREERAIEFYELLSSFDFMSSTPTLFNSGTLRPQLSSCYLTTVPDDLDGIYGAIKDNALLSKFAGGLGNDWSRVRGMGAHIKGTNGKSQGVVPFLKVANDTAVAVNQGGKRKGAVCAYLETWHIDIEEFVELRKNTGDDRRRTHDMNTANWVPDLFMKRVAEDAHWTLFSPDETPDLHDLTGQAFEQAYLAYEERAARGELKVSKRVKAVDLWRKMLAMLFETGHPWLTFKDPCNLRYTNQHVGQVHSSNLCTEITLHTNDQEIAVCNLGSVNLAAHVTERGLDTERLRKTVRTAMRMLDNVIDYNFYNVPQARNANLRHRPVGLGLMGFQDALYQLRLPYASQEAVRFADQSMEMLSYYAIEASTELAAERGRYQSFDGSLWSQGILPIDSIERLAAGRGGYLEMDTDTTLDWGGLRERVRQVGMRNSNCMAIAPTATISNIVGVGQSIEPTYQNLFVKSNLSGEFTVVNPFLVEDLKALGLWDSVMVSDLKYYDGSVQQIERIPDELKALYATAFEIDPRWLVEAGSRRQKWLDQAQSLNLYMSEPSGKKLDNLYKLAWVRGLKTTYYLRSMGATHVEKSTMDDSSKANRLSAVGGSYVSPGKAKSNGGGKPATASAAPQACAIDDPECESCQ